MDFEALRQFSIGARFRRADLHIHSFGASHDVTDRAMTPEAIVDTAIAERLEVIALTDHNSIKNVEHAIARARGSQLLVLPGVELSTTHGHLLLYFPSPDSLDRAYGRFGFSSSREYCSDSIERCLQIAAEFGGVAIAAHIEVDAGFEQKMPGHGPVKAGFLQHRNLLALEIRNTTARDWYTAQDPDTSRARLAKERREAHHRADDLPKVMSSDAHRLIDLGKNAAGNRRLTRLKMDSLSFDAFRIALLEGAVRCRLEDEIPDSYPYIAGVHFEGGFLQDQAIRFNRNLTCIIGGRGTGKSTALESIRVGTGNEGRDSIVDSDVWPDRITLWYRDESGALQALVRNRQSPVLNITDDEGLTRIQIEGYGQGETAETIQHCGKDPGVLLRFLDRFIDLSDENRLDKDLRRDLESNRVTIQELAGAVSSLPRYRELKKDAASKLERLKNDKATEVIAFEESIARERTYCTELEQLLAEFLTPTESSDLDLVEYLETQVDDALVSVGAGELEQIRNTCRELRAELEADISSSKSKRARFAKQIREQILRWREKENAARTSIEAKRKQLEAVGVQLDMGFIRKLTGNAAEFDRKIRELEQKDQRLKEAHLARKKLVKRRLELRSQIFTKRTATATKLTRNLTAESDSDFKVTLKYREGSYSPECARIITDAMQWRTARVPRAEMLVEQMTVPGLLAALEKRDLGAFARVVDNTQIALFSATDQQHLLDSLSRAEVKHKMEACAFEDRPEITVRAPVVLPNGQTREVPRDFSRLSLGQQQSIVLSLLLFSDSSDPLIIDQPEDNLDSLFIANVLVANLRKVKEKRQVIMVTHNANIAVLADAELIVPLRATSERSEIADRGSIDAELTQRHVCRILEGGETAFRRRGEIYGLVRGNK